MKAFATITAAALALVLQGAFAAAHAITASGHCTGMTVTDYVSSNAVDQTPSTNFVNLTEAHLNFTTSSPGCVLITFSGYAFISSSSAEALHVRALLDGNNLCAPALSYDGFLQAYSATEAGAGSITRACKNVAAGAHTVQMQYRSEDGGAVEIDGHVLTVTHN